MITLFCTVILRHHLLICVTIEVWAFQVVLVVKNLPANAGDKRDRHRNAGSGRSPGGGHGDPLQYSCLENSMDGRAWWAIVHRVTNSQIWLKGLSTAEVSVWRSHCPYIPTDDSAACQRWRRRKKNAWWLFSCNILLKFLFMPSLSCNVWNLTPCPGMEPRPPALGAQSLRHWTARKVPAIFLIVWCSYIPATFWTSLIPTVESFHIFYLEGLLFS